MANSGSITGIIITIKKKSNWNEPLVYDDHIWFVQTFFLSMANDKQIGLLPLFNHHSKDDRKSPIKNSLGSYSHSNGVGVWLHQLHPNFKVGKSGKHAKSHWHVVGSKRWSCSHKTFQIRLWKILQYPIWETHGAHSPRSWITKPIQAHRWGLNHPVDAPQDFQTASNHYIQVFTWDDVRVFTWLSNATALQLPTIIGNHPVFASSLVTEVTGRIGNWLFNFIFNKAMDILRCLLWLEPQIRFVDCHKHQGWKTIGSTRR